MTGDPLRPPDEPTSDPAGATGGTEPQQPPATPEAPGASEASVASESTTGEGSLTPAAAASAEAAAAAEALPPTEAVTTAEAVAAVEAAAAEAAPAEMQPSRRIGVMSALRHLAIVVLGIVLFAGGVALGNYAFQMNRTPGAAVGVGEAPLGQPATVTQEFIAALGANDADALRSSLAKDPHIDLTREMERYGIQKVDKVEILGTQVDGTRSATEILMAYQRTDGVAFAINLVVLVDGSQIEGFR